MRRVSGVMVALAGVVLGCGGSEPTGSNGGNNGGGVNTCTSTSTSVAVSNNVFSPRCTNVAVGATVTWTWGSNASNGHNVTFAGGPASDTQVSGTFQRTFNTAGTFSYQCTVHGPMTGEVRVQ